MVSCIWKWATDSDYFLPLIGTRFIYAVALFTKQREGKMDKDVCMNPES